MSELKWTTEDPTEPGWYWWQDGDRGPEIVNIVIVDDQPYEIQCCDEYCCVKMRAEDGRRTIFSIRGKRVKWAGPLKPQILNADSDPDPEHEAA